MKENKTKAVVKLDNKEIKIVNHITRLYVFHLINGFTFEQSFTQIEWQKIIDSWQRNDDYILIGRYTVLPKDLILVEDSYRK